MTLDVLDELTLARLGRVEVWVSLYWDEPYNTEGSMTLEVRPTEENLSLLREGRWLRRSDSDVPSASATGATRIPTAIWWSPVSRERGSSPSGPAPVP